VRNKGRFKKGWHWRPRRPYWDRKWLAHEYIDLKRSAADIAAQFSVHENAILFWIKKHGISTRSMREIRADKHWGSVGKKNPMYGRCGVLNPNWKGGYTPLRQAIYTSLEWKRFARQIRKRDKTCRLCGADEQLEIHHIEPFSLAPLLVMFIGNAILLCEKCHRKIYGKERRWSKRLLALLREGGASI